MEIIISNNLNLRLFKKVKNAVSKKYFEYKTKKENPYFKEAEKYEKKAFGITTNEEDKMNYLKNAISCYFNAFDHVFNSTQQEKNSEVLENIIDKIAQNSNIISTYMKLTGNHDELISIYIDLANKCKLIEENEKISVLRYRGYLMSASQIKEDKIRLLIKSNENSKIVADAYFDLSKIYEDANRIFLAIMYLKQAINLYEKINVKYEKELLTEKLNYLKELFEKY